MNITQMRKFITKAYPGSTWTNKVKRMEDNQVIAIYYNMLSKKEVAVEKNDSNKQLSMFDIY